MDAAAAARDGQTALALRLAKHLAPPPATAGGADDDDASARGCGNGNVAFSPVSVHAALALVAAGARGATLEQLLAFLGAPCSPTSAAASRTASRDGLADAFRDVAADVHKSEARTVSFAKEPEAAVKMINEWVKKATANLIGSIISVDDINGDVDLVLANAVYFKGAWQSPFITYETWTGAFHRLDGVVTKPMFMTGFKDLNVACMDGFKVVKLPYEPGAAPASQQRKRRRGRGAASKSKATPSAPEVDEGTRYSMFVFLPDAPGGLSTMVDMVTASPAFLYGVLAEMKTRRVKIKLPKFEISFSWSDLKRDLSRLGLSLPFSREAAHLRGMCEVVDDDAAASARRPTFLSKVAHMAVVKVNEAGTEAAAVTAALYGGGRPPDTVEFTADHPFTFFIMEELSGVIVFAGHVLDPTK
ncbi:hypothetical protein U9M48_002096 [Paspalum notatum var. saurae]|uniref:Serpin domain-containing protein n=1 Tax=Paspalum notatum var. saurae TaxID=547442 RepID=A0AAQ3PKF0_PASNO